MANILDWDIVVSKFELQSHYYAYFWTNSNGKSIKHLSLRLLVK